VWALGCIVYELCTLQLAFPGKLPQLYVKINDGKYEPIPPNLPYSDNLRELVDLLLQKNPKDRPQAVEIPALLE
jgi:NIMA (never in mitosis gene a)-related kinase